MEDERGEGGLTTALESIFGTLAAPEATVNLTDFGIERLSPSSIEGFIKCPEQWRQERIAKAPRFSTGEQLFGSAFHRAAEHNYRQKIVSHEDLAEKEMRDLTGDSFNEVLEETKGESEIRWYDSEPGEVQAGVITAMVGLDGAPGYLQVLAPAVQPVAVERWLEVPTVLGVPLVGKLDVETETVIRDLKTGKKRKTQADLDSNIQATAYLYMRDAEQNPAQEFGWHVAVRTIKPSQQELSTSRTVGEFAAFERLLLVTANTIADYMGRYGPESRERPSAWWCASSQCSFWRRAWWGEVSVTLDRSPRPPCRQP